MASIKIDQIAGNIFMKSRTTFQLLTTTLLSLLLPLSFLLLSRLSTASLLNDQLPVAAAQPPSSLVFFSFLLNSIPLSPLHLLVSLLSVASLAHTLNDAWMMTFPRMRRPSLHTAWIVLCTLQVCVGLGIEGSIGAGIDGSGLGEEKRNLTRDRSIVFFLGLHATMVYWSRMIVKPVVDDTMFGSEMEERWVERVVMGASLGGLWWWRVRDEVEALVVAMEMKREVEVVDVMGWWLYYLVVTIGMVRLVKGLIWFGLILLCRKVEVRDDNDSLVTLGVEDKV